MLLVPRRGRDPSYHRDFLVGFDHIPLLDILKAFDGETTFVTGGYLTDVVLETFQAAQFAFVHDHLISQATALTYRAGLFLQRHSSRHRTRAGDIEDLANLTRPRICSRYVGSNNPSIAALDIGDCFVDDRVQTHVDAFFSSQRGTLGIPAHI